MHAEEQNVNNLQSTKVTNITEVLAEYPTIQEDNNSDLSQIFEDLKYDFVVQWQEYNKSFRGDTGFKGFSENGTLIYMPQYTDLTIDPKDQKDKGEGYGIASHFYNWKEWNPDSPTNQKLIQLVNEFISNKRLNKAGMNEYLKNESSRGLENNYKNHTFYCQISNNNEQKFYITHGNNYANPIQSTTGNTYHTDMQNHILSDILTTSPLIYSNDYLITNKDTFKIKINKNYFNCKINWSLSPSNADFNRSETYNNIYVCESYVSKAYLQIDTNVTDTILGTTFETARYNAIPEETVFSQVMMNVLCECSTTNTDSPYYDLRKELTKIMYDEYVNQYAYYFWYGLDSVNTDTNWDGVEGLVEYTNQILNRIYFFDQNKIQYCNFVFTCPSRNNNGVWSSKRTGYYFPFANAENENTMGFKKSERHQYIYLTDDEISNYCYVKDKILFPAKIEFVFTRDIAPKYQSWLTSSIIVKNDLNHYQYWAENISNEYDETYYGEPIKINLSNDQSGYLTKEDLKLKAADHWGTMVFTRYKYVDYTYYMYYAILANNNSKMAAKMNVTTESQRNAWNEYRSGITNATLSYANYNEELSKTLTDGISQPFAWVHAWTKPNEGTSREFSNLMYGNSAQAIYWVSDDEISSAVNVVENHLAAEKPQTEGGGMVDIIWGGESIYKEEWWNHFNTSGPIYREYNYQQSSLRKINGINGYGDYYRYSEPVRAEVTYYQVLVAINAETPEYELCLGVVDNIPAPCMDHNGCQEGKVLCQCEDEFGTNSCDLSKENFDYGSTLIE